MDLQKRKKELLQNLSQAREQATIWMNKIQQLQGAITIIEEQLQAEKGDAPESPKTEEKPAE